MEADYVVVGAGSAGCVVAARLSETGAQGDPAGGRAEGLAAMDPHPRRHAEAAAPSRGQLELQRRGPAGSAGRAIHWPRGKTLGGSSSINGMLYVRGNPADFDGWAQMGCRGWSFDDVLPFFRKSEDYVPGRRPGIPRQGRPAAGRGLPHHPAADPPLRRSRAAGRATRFSKDLNGGEQEGVGYSQMTRNGRFRGSTARPSCAAAKGRPNLRVETDALATRLLFEGKRCAGVAFRQRGQRPANPRRARGDPVRRRGELAASAADLRASDRPSICNRSACRWCTTCAASAPICRIITSRACPHRVKGAISINQLARGVRLAREVARFSLERQRRADLRRHHRAGVLPIARGTGQPGPATAVHARQLRCARSSASWNARTA